MRNRLNHYNDNIKGAAMHTINRRNTVMILADKIITLRKKAGWSQEELAEQLSVTRQSVSKWEGAQSVPDMDKILQMSRLFGVTTDYLLKDELEEEEQIEGGEITPLSRVTMEDASRYLAQQQAAAPKMSLATFLCVISPVCLILFSGLSDEGRLAINSNLASGLGLCILIIMVAVGVTIFLSCSFKIKEFEFLKNGGFETEYGVTGMVRQRKSEFQPVYSRFNIIGTVLCIISVLPLFISICLEDSIKGDAIYIIAVCMLLTLVGIGCVCFVVVGVPQGAMDRLLSEGDYTPAKKETNKLMGTVSLVYWLIVTAIFLYYISGVAGQHQVKNIWFIWAIAGVIFGALAAVVKLIHSGSRK